MAFRSVAAGKRVATTAREEDDVEWYSKLTPELWEQILSWVPVKTLLESCSIVSMAWKYTIRHPKFIQLQLHHATNGGGETSSNNNKLLLKRIETPELLLPITPPFILNEEEEEAAAFITIPEYIQLPDMEFSKILGLNYQNRLWEPLSTCKGIVCMMHRLFGEERKLIVLLNPAAKRGKIVPIEPIDIPPGLDIWDSVTFGFGSCPDVFTGIDDFKVIRITYFSVYITGVDQVICEVKIYSTVTDSWRRIGDIPCDIQRGFPGLFVCGALHWMGTRSRTKPDGMKWWETILAFDIDKEEFREIVMPPCERTPKDEMILMDRRADCLSMLHFTHDFEIWVMKDYKQESWTRDYIIRTTSVDLHDLDRCSALFIKGDQILLRGIKKPAFHNMVSESRMLIKTRMPSTIHASLLLDLKANKIYQKFGVRAADGHGNYGKPMFLYELVTYIETLVSPKSFKLRPLSSSSKKRMGESSSKEKKK